MASPFTFFRKNQQSMMVVLVILAMLVFTLDSVFSSRDSQFVVLGLLLGGTIFAFSGIRQGRWMQYGAAGAILGALCGWILPPWLSTADGSGSAVNSALGKFDDKRIFELARQRGIANQFMYRATAASLGEETAAALGSQLAAFAYNFGFGNSTEEEDVVFGELMRAEADELGIVVTNDMVSQFIKTATDNKLTSQGFAKCRSELVADGRRMTDEELFDVLREEIKAQLAFQTLHPQQSVLYQAPGAEYARFRQLHVSQKLNTAMVDVDAFLSQVPEPSDKEVSELFTANRQKYPNQDEAGSPGFRQPRKTKLAYLELDYQKVEASVPAISDADVEAHYNSNKDTLYRRPVAPAVPEKAQTPPDSPAVPETPESATPATPETPAAPATPDAATPAPAAPAPDASPAPEVKPEPKAEEPKAEEPKPEEPKAEEPKAEEPKAEEPAEPKADSECGPGLSESSENQESGASEAPTAQVPQDAPAAAPAETPAAETPAAETPAAEAAPVQSPAPEKKEEAAAESPAAEVPAESTAEPAAAAAQTPDVLTIPAAGGEKPPEFPEQKYEIRALDDTLKEEIRDLLLKQRVAEAIEAKMVAIMKEMQRMELERRSVRLEMKSEFASLSDEEFAKKIGEYSPTINAEAKKLAEKSGVAYVETPFVSDQQLVDGEAYPIGLAVPPGGNMFNQSGPPVVSLVFEAPGDELQFFRPRRAVRASDDMDKGESHYAWWIIDDSPAHVPTIDEPGIREEVVLTWKRIRARELAKKRAEELAKLVREGMAKPEAPQQMSTTLENVTATGKDDSPVLAVRQTERFSWMQQQNMPQMNFNQQRPRVVLSSITFAGSDDRLELAFQDFMKAVFEDLKNNETAAVPNADLSKYYVVHVIDRTPTPEVGEDALRQRFMTEFGRGVRQSPVFSMLREQVEGPAVNEWVNRLWLKYDVDRTKAPESE